MKKWIPLLLKLLLILVIFSGRLSFAESLDVTCKNSVVNPSIDMNEVDQQLKKFQSDMESNSIIYQALRAAVKAGEEKLVAELLRMIEKKVHEKTNIVDTILTIRTYIGIANSVQAYGKADNDLAKYSALSQVVVDSLSLALPAYSLIFQSVKLQHDLNTQIIMMKSQEDVLKIQQQIADIRLRTAQDKFNQAQADIKLLCHRMDKIEAVNNLAIAVGKFFEAECLLKDNRFSLDYVDRCLSLAQKQMYLNKRQIDLHQLTYSDQYLILKIGPMVRSSEYEKIVNKLKYNVNESEKILEKMSKSALVALSEWMNEPMGSAAPYLKCERSIGALTNELLAVSIRNPSCLPASRQDLVKQAGLIQQIQTLSTNICKNNLFQSTKQILTLAESQQNKTNKCLLPEFRKGGYNDEID